MKHSIVFILSSALLVSCKKADPPADQTSPPALDKVRKDEKSELPGKSSTVVELPPLKKLPHFSSEVSTPPSAPTPDPEMPKPLPKSKYQTAKAIPGKSGYVANPFTGGDVDVRGIPPGSLVRDPNDPNPDHKFRMPQLED